MHKTLILTAATLALAACSNAPDATKSTVQTDPMGLSTLEKITTVDERYQAYNVEMVEVTGGRFWAPYGGPADERYRERPSIDLNNPKLINLAKHLSPSMMRVSGTWANNTYLLAEGETLTTPPEGYKQILTRDQWKNVIAFSKAVDAPLVTSFAVSAGTRDEDGVWTTVQAQRLADLTKEAGGTIYAAEFFNEPNVPSATIGMPEDYGPENYAAEFRMFKDWASETLPDMKTLGPGGVGEGGLFPKIPVPGLGPHISSEDLMKSNPDSVDVMSYHFYGTVSQRCEALGIGTAVKSEALSDEWLDRTVRDWKFYAALRDKYEAGKDIWNTETAQAACGGSPWAKTFLDSFRYLNQLGALAQNDVKVVMHNTLAASDYALIDQDTIEPRPNYWAAIMWRKTMGSTVLASPKSPSPKLRLYSHCLADTKGGVGVMALNLGEASQTLGVGQKAVSWTMTASPLDSKFVSINGNTPAMDEDGNLSGLDGSPVQDNLSVPGQSIAFLAVPDADNKACR